MKESALINFIENDLNNNNTWHNSCAFDDAYYEKHKRVRVVFYRRPSEMYARLLRFCADNGGIIIKTHPATLVTIVEVERG